MADLSAIFHASLDPGSRKQAEKALEDYSAQPGFALHLLKLALEGSQDRAVRLAASVYLKNIARKRWVQDPEDDVQPISSGDKAQLRSHLVPAMIQLSQPGDKALRAQIAETVSLVAAADFPEEWSSLFDARACQFTLTHGAIPDTSCARDRTFNLWAMEVFRVFAGALFEGQNVGTLEVQGQISWRLLQLYYDLTAQDLPPIFEDTLTEFFAPSLGWFPKYLNWASPELAGDPDDTTPSLLSQIKTTVLEIAELFTLRYGELFTDTSTIGSFIETVWKIVSSGNHPAVGDDPLIAQCMRLLSSTIKSGQYKSIYDNKNSLEELIRGIVVPNVQLRATSGSASFSSTGGGDGTTRRQAAADVVKALTSSGYEAQATEIVLNWIQLGLQEYQKNPSENWKYKSSAIYLTSAVAARGTTLQDLQSASGSVHPILQVDAIRFIYTFRNQLTKPQLLSVLPLLVQHLASSNYVTCTYSAIAIERILFMKQPNTSQPLFNPDDVQSFAQGALEALLSKMESGKSAEKIAENDYLMKSPIHGPILSRIVSILGAEDIDRKPYFILDLKGLIHLSEFVPYAYQIISQLLELNQGAVPEFYKGVLTGILQPPPWQQKGSIPGLVRFIRAYLDKDAAGLLQSKQFETVLGVIQQRLIPSKLHDGWAFELLEGTILNTRQNMQPYLRDMVMSLLNRLRTSRTDKFVVGLIRFTAYVSSLESGGYTPDTIPDVINGIQAHAEGTTPR
ncbi:6838_t:CDS:10 [Acaulospora colombiana]|uniref:6838_t:CDS:1 n=1 Tax=Acaulospora colombiana TaxID=27376 RepID=A0ACA9MM04_9GLOM|nr:6838_t:CDS:10 [Acaulospora colombiana]